MGRSRTGRNLAIVIALAVAIGGCGGDDAASAGGPGGGGPGGPGGGMPPMPVEAVTLKLQPLAGGLQTVGSLRADESVVVRPEVAGRIVRIHFTEGGRVQSGQPLFTLDGSVPQAALNEAMANLENSRRAMERSRQLIDQKLIAQSDYDRALATHGVDQARVASARTILSKMTLRAPFSGEIGLRKVSVGEFVNVGQDLVTLVRLDPIEVDFSVPESALSQLERGRKIHVTVDAFPGENFGGEVTAIDPVVDPNSRSARLRARIANPDGRLRPGQFAQLRLEVGSGANALMVPEQALMQEGDTRFVYTIVDGKAKKTVVKTGTRTPGLVQVTDGLKSGDVVITAGQAKPMMHEGAAVMPLPAEGAPQGSPQGAPSQGGQSPQGQPRRAAANGG